MFIFGIKINNNGIIRKDRKYNHYIFNPNLINSLNKLILPVKSTDYFIEDTIISPL